MSEQQVHMLQGCSHRRLGCAAHMAILWMAGTHLHFLQSPRGPMSIATCQCTLVTPCNQRDLLSMCKSKPACADCCKVYRLTRCDKRDAKSNAVSSDTDFPPVTVHDGGPGSAAHSPASMSDLYYTNHPHQ